MYYSGNCRLRGSVIDWSNYKHEMLRHKMLRPGRAETSMAGKGWKGHGGREGQMDDLLDDIWMILWGIGRDYVRV